MNFFKRQSELRRHSLWLGVLFGLAVLSPVFLLGAGLYALEVYQNLKFSTEVYATVLGAPIVIALIGTCLRYFDLQNPNVGFTRLFSASPLMGSSSEENEKRLMNVVAEMSIASGIRPPEIVVLKYDHSINAFASGLSPHQGLIGVTQGAIAQLDRDELQALVAHEMGHLVDGDTVIHVRTASLLHGLFFISSIGSLMLRVRGRQAAGINALGLGMIAVGSIGVLMGRAIQAKLSQKREFLADASAVQFTRHPEAVVRLLRKVENASTSLVHPEASELSFIFFHSWLASHPPIVERIAAINAKAVQTIQHASNQNVTERASAGTNLHYFDSSLTAQDWVFGLLGGSYVSVDKKVSEALGQWQASSFEEKFRMLESATQMLRDLSQNQRRLFFEQAKKLALHDQQVTLKEWALLRWFDASDFAEKPQKLSDLVDSIEVLFSTLGWVSNLSESEVGQIFGEMRQTLKLKLSFRPKQDCRREAVEAALDRLQVAVSIDDRQKLYEAAKVLILRDRHWIENEFWIALALSKSLKVPFAS